MYICFVNWISVIWAERFFFFLQLNWWGPVVLAPGGSGVVGSLGLVAPHSHLSLATHLSVRTNLTTVALPLQAYNGKLSKASKNYAVKNKNL